MSAELDRARERMQGYNEECPPEYFTEALAAFEASVREDQRAKTWCEARAVVEDMLVGIDRVDRIGIALLKRMNEKEDESP